jgi:oxygen-independent coproporphyrinogen-3 oxidase
MKRPLHLYVHVPFCARKCPYCHFYNIGHDDGREALYVDALAREIDTWRRLGVFDNAELATLYWGGGTPSILSEPGFSRLADVCLDVGAMAHDFEWTIELNPADAEPGRLSGYRARGVNRLSIGAQSFDVERLTFLERGHSGGESRRAVLTAVEAGFDDISIDLMFNLAVSGRRKAWATDLRLAFDLPITHLSLYGLTIESGTAFGVRDRAGPRLTVSGRAYGAEYRAACRVARRAGFDHYEVSSFAQPGRQARHNSAYWSGRPYLGLGPSAHSFDGQRRWANAPSLTEWAEALAIGADPRAFVETLDPFQRSLEILYLELRTAAGVSVDHPLLDSTSARRVVAELVAEDLCHLSADRLACTERGFLVYDGILDRLVAFAHRPKTAPIATVAN